VALLLMRRPQLDASWWRHLCADVGLCCVAVQELKRVCLDFVSRNLAAVMQTDGYRHMTSRRSPEQAEKLLVSNRIRAARD